MKKHTQNQISMLLTMLFIVSGLAQADVFMKQKRHTGGMEFMGQKQPAEDVVEEIWITDEGFRSNNPKNSVMMLLEKKVMIIVNHTDKSYMEMPMNMEDMMSRMNKTKDTKDAANVQDMMKGMMKMDATVTQTGEKKRINKWNCRKYIMTINTFMGTFNNEIWATEDLKIDSDIYARFTSGMMAAIPGMQDAVSGMIKEMKKIKGVQVRTVSTQKIMNQTITSTSELLDFKQGKAPAGVFKVPSGYKKNTMPR